MNDKQIHTRYCNFCGKTEHEVKKLIAGPTVFICDECTLLCMAIILQADHGFITEITKELETHLEHKYERKDY